MEYYLLCGFMNFSIIKFLVTICLCVAINVASQENSVTIIRVKDGDTYEAITRSKDTITIRLADVDTPEKGQPYGKEAKEAVIKLLLNKNVTLQKRYAESSTDRNGRVIAYLYTSGGIDIGRKLLELGLAWNYTKFSETGEKYEEYTKTENTAKKNRIGLWFDEKPIEPWVWRRLPKEQWRVEKLNSFCYWLKMKYMTFDKAQWESAKTEYRQICKTIDKQNEYNFSDEQKKAIQESRKTCDEIFRNYHSYNETNL